MSTIPTSILLAEKEQEIVELKAENKRLAERIFCQRVSGGERQKQLAARAERAEDRVKSLEVSISTAIGAAVHDGKPCPLCGAAYESNMWPYHVHEPWCVRRTMQPEPPAPSDSVSEPQVSLYICPQCRLRVPENAPCPHCLAQDQLDAILHDRESNAPVSNASGAARAAGEEAHVVRRNCISGPGLALQPDMGDGPSVVSSPRSVGQGPSEAKANRWAVCEHDNLRSRCAECSRKCHVCQGQEFSTIPAAGYLAIVCNGCASEQRPKEAVPVTCGHPVAAQYRGPDGWRCGACPNEPVTIEKFGAPWEHGREAAGVRLREVLTTGARFDARDRAALAYLLTTSEEAPHPCTDSPKDRLRCLGCGHFENEVAGTTCKHYGEEIGRPDGGVDGGHFWFPVDEHGIARKPYQHFTPRTEPATSKAQFTIEGESPVRPVSWRAVGPWRSDFRMAQSDAGQGPETPVAMLPCPPVVSVRDLGGEGDGPWRLFVGDYGVADWPLKQDHDPKEYAEEVARCIRLALWDAATQTGGTE